MIIPTPAIDMKMSRARLQRAFILIKLFIVVAIIGVFAAVAILAYSDYIELILVMQVFMGISSIGQRLTVNQIITEKFPDTLVEINQDGLLDPWGNSYHYLNLSDIKGKSKARKDHKLVPINSSYDLYSSGKDGRSNGPLKAKTSRNDIVLTINGRSIVY